MKDLDNFYAQQQEPVKSCLLALRDIILASDKDVSHEWKYSMPFFCYQGKMFCYLWIDKKSGEPYLGMMEGKRIEHPSLVFEKRSRIKIMHFNPAEDLPLNAIKNILQQAIDLYRNGLIALKSR